MNQESAKCCELVQGAHCNRYFFDHVFGQKSSQEEVFGTVVRPLVHSLVRGISSLVFTYGVTNSGKTYTVHGLEGEVSEGLLPRIFRSAFGALDLLQEPEGKGYEIVDEFGNYNNFDVIQQHYDPQTRYLLVFSALEIFNEKLLDLLDGDSNDLKMVEEGGEMVVKGVQEIEVKTMDEALRFLRTARSRIQMGQTLCNADSSRSHSAFTVSLCKADGACAIAEVLAKLTICDLAGSERANRTQTSGPRLREASNINQSLVVLGRCLEALRWNQTHPPSQRRMVPYREAKITRLFQPTLSGNGNAVMIVNVSPCTKDVDETVHALKYSSVAKEVVNIASAAPLKRKIQVSGADGCQPGTMQQALSEIQNLNAQLSEAKEALNTVENNIRHDLSTRWVASLQSLQLSMMQQQKEQEECAAQLHARRMLLHERQSDKRLKSLKEALTLRMVEHLKEDCSDMVDSDDEPEPTEAWRGKHVHDLQRRVSTLNAKLGEETQKYYGVRQELEELRRIMELQEKERTHEESKQLAMLQNSLASMEHMNTLLQCEVDSLKGERARWERSCQEVGRRLKDQESKLQSENMAGDLRDKELAAKDRELRTLQVKVESLQKALAAEENIQQNQKKTIDSLTTANIHAANTIQSQHQISEAQKVELQHFVTAEQRWREDLAKSNQTNLTLQGIVDNLKDRAEKAEAEGRATPWGGHVGLHTPAAGTRSMVSIAVDTADLGALAPPQLILPQHPPPSYPSAVEDPPLKGASSTRSPRLPGAHSTTLRTAAVANSAALARSSPRCAVSPSDQRRPEISRTALSDRSRFGTPTQRRPLGHPLEQLRRTHTPERARTPTPVGGRNRCRTPDGHTPSNRKGTPTGRYSPSPGRRKGSSGMAPPVTLKSGRALHTAARRAAREQSGSDAEASFMSVDGMETSAGPTDAAKEGARDVKAIARASPAQRRPGVTSPRTGWASPARRLSGQKRGSNQMCITAESDDTEKRRKRAAAVKMTAQGRDALK